MSGGFQTQVGANLAPAVAGDRASQNSNLYSVLAGPGALVAGPGGVTIGVFAWLSTNFLDADSDASIVNSFGAGPVAGFVMREQQGLITTYLADASMVIPGGMDVSVFDSGDFWVVNNGAAQALPGMKAYANYANGQATFAAAAAPTTASATASIIEAYATTASVTASLNGNVLNVTAVDSGLIYPGAQITSGAGVAAGTTIVAQLSGTTGGVGTYAVNVPEQSVASEAMTITSYELDTTGGTVTGSVILGSTIQSTGGSITGNVVGAQVTQLNAYGAGKHAIGLVNSPGSAMGSATSGTVVLASNVETKWYARTSALPGELVKMSSTPLG